MLSRALPCSVTFRQTARNCLFRRSADCRLRAAAGRTSIGLGVLSGSGDGMLHPQSPPPTGAQAGGPPVALRAGEALPLFPESPAEQAFAQGWGWFHLSSIVSRGKKLKNLVPWKARLPRSPSTR